MDKAYILAVDVGTSTIRAVIYNKQALIKSVVEKPVRLIYGGKMGQCTVEIDPNELWDQFLQVVIECMKIVGADNVATMGICSQRNTFITWDRVTQQPCHRFITWRDDRARNICTLWNQSWMLSFARTVGSLLYFFTRNNRFLAMHMFRFVNSMVTHRLVANIDQNSHCRDLMCKNRLIYGCMDTWLLYKLTGSVVSEPSTASSTGTFDPFTMDWAYPILKWISFPIQLLPPLVDTAGHLLGVADADLFGSSIPIGALYSTVNIFWAADQQAAVFGCGRWKRGQVSISMGSGTFLDVNTGSIPHASMHGIYPLVGWRIGPMTAFVAEASSNDTASILHWAQSIGLFNSVADTSSMANSVSSSNGVSFVPAFTGLQTPINDDVACCGFLGLRPDTSKEHLVRALLEAIAFRAYQMWTTLNRDIDFPLIGVIRCCGGVSSNDFICQMIANLIELSVERVCNEQYSASLGIAFMAGLSVDFWQEKDLEHYIRVEKTFNPNVVERSILISTYTEWCKAVERCMHFY